MPARYLVCSACEGTKKGDDGDTCLHCGGQGGSIYGEDRPREEIERDIESTERILRLDQSELAQAQAKLHGCKPSQREQCRRHIESVKSGLVYWEFRMGLLRHELTHNRARAEVRDVS